MKGRGNMINALKQKIKANLENYYQDKYELPLNIVVEEPKKLELGDLSIPAFIIAKALKKPLPECAAEAKDYLLTLDFIKDVSILGGFINLTIDKENISYDIVKDCVMQGNNYGNFEKNNKNIVIDYSSPNIAKPFSIGHLRSTIIGNSLKLIFQKAGYNVVGINHLGDWGTQFGKVIVAYEKWGDEEKVKANPLKELSQLYVRFHEEAKLDPSLDDEGRRIFKLLEDGDEHYLALWRWFREESLKESMQMYDLLGVSFDSYDGEGFFNDKMEPVVLELEQKGLLKIDDNATIVDLGSDMPPALIKRSDGATLYITRDLAALFYRKKTYDFDKVLYVVGNEQKLHFKQLKMIVEKMGYDFVDDIIHVGFGLVMRDGKKMSTRKGGVVTLYEVLQEAIKLSYEAIEAKNPTLENKEEVAKAIGVGAVMFNDLKNHRNLDIEFDLNQMVKFEGQTGPYLQYTGVRIASILRDNTYDINNICKEVFLKDQYYEIVKLLSQFKTTILKSIEDYAPSVIAKYLLSLAQAFNKFYATEKINAPIPEIKNANMALAHAVKIVLDEGLRLLGLKSLERM